MACGCSAIVEGGVQRAVEAAGMAAADADVAFFQNSAGSLHYLQVARQLQTAVADLAQTLPHGCPAIPFPSKCVSRPLQRFLWLYSP